MASTEFLVPVYPSLPQENDHYALDYYALDDYTQDHAQINDHSLDNRIASVSTTFHVGAPTAQTAADTIFLSSDSVLFYVHSHVILKISNAAFESVLPAPLFHSRFRSEAIPIPEPSPVLDVILHVLYGISPAAHAPTLDTVTTALTHLPRYGISPKAHLTAAHPMHALLLSFAPQAPIELYTLAAQLDLHDLAVPASAYLLPYPLAGLTDGMAVRMGAVYLRRLLMLHFDRTSALKDIVLARRLVRAWALVSAYLAWECRPGE